MSLINRYPSVRCWPGVPDTSQSKIFFEVLENAENCQFCGGTRLLGLLMNS